MKKTTNFKKCKKKMRKKQTNKLPKRNYSSSPNTLFSPATSYSARIRPTGKFSRNERNKLPTGISEINLQQERAKYIHD